MGATVEIAHCWSSRTPLLRHCPGRQVLHREHPASPIRAGRVRPGLVWQHAGSLVTARSTAVLPRMRDRDGTGARGQLGVGEHNVAQLGAGEVGAGQAGCRERGARGPCARRVHVAEVRDAIYTPQLLKVQKTTFVLTKMVIVERTDLRYASGQLGPHSESTEACAGCWRN